MVLRVCIFVAVTAAFLISFAVGVSIQNHGSQPRTPVHPEAVPLSGPPRSQPASVSVSGKVVVPSEYLRGVRLSLNGDFISLVPSRFGDFEVGPLPPGSYILQPSHPLLRLSSYLVNIPEASASADPQVFFLGESFRPLYKMPLPLIIAPLDAGPPVYFAVKPPFNLLFLLQQPLLLVAIACCGLMWCLPRLQQYQEEDERQHRAALQQQQQRASQEELLVDQVQQRNTGIYEQNDSSAACLRQSSTAASAWVGHSVESGESARRFCAAALEGSEDDNATEADRSLFSKYFASIRTAPMYSMRSPQQRCAYRERPAGYR